MTRTAAMRLTGTANDALDRALEETDLDERAKLFAEAQAIATVALCYHLHEGSAAVADVIRRIP